MKTIEKYQTSDGKIHDSIDKAETYAYYKAVAIVQDAINAKDAAIANSYGIAKRIVEFFIENKHIIRLLLKWIEDIDSESK